MAIHNYEKGSNEILSAYFLSSEFDCRGSGCCDKTKIDSDLLSVLEAIRVHFGRRVMITSGYRCARHNASVGGAAGSKHLLGSAADIRVEDTAPLAVAQFAQRLGVGGIGLYDTDADGHFVHIDTRKAKRFWYGQKQEKRTTFLKEEITVKLRKLYYGCCGRDVAALQQLLTANGHKCSADGKFGAKTKAALIAYQKSKNLSADAVAGEKTFAALLGVDGDE